MKGIERDLLFYLLGMLLTILVALMILGGGNPMKVFEKKTFKENFEPGTVGIIDAHSLSDWARLTCPAQDDHILTINGLKFGTTEIPSSEKDRIDFLVVLDLNSLLFLGTDQDGRNVLPCGVNDDEYECPQDIKMDFILNRIGRLEGNYTFHFTLWEAGSGVAGAINDPEMTFGKMLDNYPEYYIASFDITTNIETECRRNFCNDIKEEDLCKLNLERGCYWDETRVTAFPTVVPIYIENCRLCRPFSSCGNYNQEECRQCPEARANCASASLFGIYMGCEAQ